MIKKVLIYSAFSLLAVSNVGAMQQQRPEPQIKIISIGDEVTFGGADTSPTWQSRLCSKKVVIPTAAATIGSLGFGYWLYSDQKRWESFQNTCNSWWDSAKRYKERIAIGLIASGALSYAAYKIFCAKPAQAELLHNDRTLAGVNGPAEIPDWIKFLCTLCKMVYGPQVNAQPTIMDTTVRPFMDKIIEAKDPHLMINNDEYKEFFNGLTDEQKLQYLSVLGAFTIQEEINALESIVGTFKEDQKDLIDVLMKNGPSVLLTDEKHNARLTAEQRDAIQLRIDYFDNCRETVEDFIAQYNIKLPQEEALAGMQGDETVNTTV